MKHGSEYAKRVKRLYNRLRRDSGKSPQVNQTDPLEQLILGILARDVSESKAQSAYARLMGGVVDLNDLRVTPWVEVTDVLQQDLPDAENRARMLVGALNAIYDRCATVTLAFLRGKSVREAREYLRALPGIDEYAAARVVLFGLGGHAIPIDETTVQVFRQEELVGPEATLPEVQSFLERHIRASDAVDFTMLVHRYTRGRARAVVPDAPTAAARPKRGKKASASSGASENGAATSATRETAKTKAKKTAAKKTVAKKTATKKSKKERGRPAAGTKTRKRLAAKRTHSAH
ncbi:MAG: hypothetical protein JXA69_07375 [Phycisphaerae bacterium]|nr:hypothetical protein [Phycisphaerae bacterium]